MGGGCPPGYFSPTAISARACRNRRRCGPHPGSSPTARAPGSPPRSRSGSGASLLAWAGHGGNPHPRLTPLSPSEARGQRRCKILGCSPGGRHCPCSGTASLKSCPLPLVLRAPGPLAGSVATVPAPSPSLVPRCASASPVPSLPLCVSASLRRPSSPRLAHLAASSCPNQTAKRSSAAAPSVAHQSRSSGTRGGDVAGSGAVASAGQ